MSVDTRQQYLILTARHDACGETVQLVQPNESGEYPERVEIEADYCRNLGGAWPDGATADSWMTTMHELALQDLDSSLSDLLELCAERAEQLEELEAELEQVRDDSRERLEDALEATEEARSA